MRTLTLTHAPLSEEDRDELGRWLDCTPELPMLTPEQEATATVDQLVEHNLRLAVRVAMCHAGRGVPVSDLVQEASIGLMRAARDFDRTRGVLFSTYATRIVFDFVTRAVHNQGSAIRLPVHVQENRSQKTANDRTRASAKQAGRVNSLDSLLGTGIVRDARYVAEGRDPRGFGDLLADPSADTAGEAMARVEQLEQRQLIAELLCCLKPREQQAVELHIIQGLTFAEVAPMMGCSSQRVHQLINSARLKMTRLYLTGRKVAA